MAYTLADVAETPPAASVKKTRYTINDVADAPQQAQSPSLLDKTISAMPKIGQAAGSSFGPIGEMVGRGVGEAAARNPQVTKPVAQVAMASAPAIAGMAAGLGGAAPASAAAMAARAGMEIKDKGTMAGAAGVLREATLGRGPMTAVKDLAVKNPGSMAKIAGEGLLQHVAEVPALIKSALASQSGLRAAKALGATKAHLNTAKKFQEAHDVGKTMLNAVDSNGERVVTATSTPEEMAAKVEDLITTNGEKIGAYLNSVGAKFNLTKMTDILEQLRPKASTGKLLKGGDWDVINHRIDNAIRTINGFAQKVKTLTVGPDKLLVSKVKNILPEIEFADANKLKRMFQEGTNWYGKTPADVADRVIAGKVRASIDDSLEAFGKLANKGKEFEEFKQAKRVYSHAQKAKDYLYNRLSSEYGNKSISLTDWSAIIAGAATGGNPVTAAGTLAAKKITEKFGAQVRAQVRNPNTFLSPLKMRIGLIGAEGAAGKE